MECWLPEWAMALGSLKRNEVLGTWALTWATIDHIDIVAKGILVKVIDPGDGGNLLRDCLFPRLNTCRTVTR